MEREAESRFEPGAVATDISQLLTALAGITELGSRAEVNLASATPLRSLVEEVTSRTRALAQESLEARAEVVGAEDTAVEKARRPIERLPLEDADHSTVVGTIRDVRSGEVAEAGRVVAKDTDGQVIGEGVVDSTGNFAIELTASVNEIHIEALDEAGRSVSVSTVEMADTPSAHFIEMVTSRKRGAEAADSKSVTGLTPTAETVLGREERSEHLRRIRESVIKTSDVTPQGRRK